MSGIHLALVLLIFGLLALALKKLILLSIKGLIFLIFASYVAGWLVVHHIIHI